MEISNNWIVLRIMYSHSAQGRSGNLTSDLLNLCEEMKVNAFVFKDEGGSNDLGILRKKYMLGDYVAEVPILMEFVLTKDKLDSFKSKSLEILKEGNDNAAFYTMPVEGYIFNPDINK